MDFLTPFFLWPDPGVSSPTLTARGRKEKDDVRRDTRQMVFLPNAGSALHLARSPCPVTQDIAARLLPPSSLLVGRVRRFEAVELECVPVAWQSATSNFDETRTSICK